MITRERTFFTKEETSVDKKYILFYDGILICQMIDFLIDNIYIEICNHLFGQCVGSPVGRNCVPLMASLSLYSSEV